MRYAYLVVEGPHDVEFVARLLKPYGLKRIQLKSRVDLYWDPLIPKTFPQGDDLLMRVPVPAFFASEALSIAINAAGGDSRVAPTVAGSLGVLRDVAQLEAIGAILDADSEQPPMDRFKNVKAALAGLALSVPDQPGAVSSARPRCGVFVVPDNQSQGTLEDLLLECAASSYPTLLAEARTLVGRIDPTSPEFQGEDMREFKKPAGRAKATIASMAGILKPGKAVQVSIQDNRWMEGAALELSRLREVRRFLQELLGLPDLT